MNGKKSKLVTAVLIVLLATACTGLRFVPEDETLYTGAEVKLETRGDVGSEREIKERIRENILPKPNTTILGSRPGLWFYHIAGTPRKKKGIRNFIKTKLGQKPVYLSDVYPERTARLLEGTLANNGFFRSSLSYEVHTRKKKSSVVYTAYVYPPYHLRNIEYPSPHDSSALHAQIGSTLPGTLLKKGQRYSLENLQNEQQRIEDELENKGYFYFDDRYLIFEADSTVGNRQIDIWLMPAEGIPDKAKQIYRIGEITIHPDHTITGDSITETADTLRVQGFRYIDREKRFRPEAITRVITLKEGNIYRRRDHDYTLSHLMNLGPFRFANVKFSPSPYDSSVLDADIYLTSFLKKSLRFEFAGISQSNNFIGPATSIQFSNRNFLRGGERFDITVNAGYQVQIGQGIDEPLNAFELDIESRLTFPRIITPFPFRYQYHSRRYLPTSAFRLGYQLQQRIRFFRLNSFYFSFGYNWRETLFKNHTLYPADINYLRLSNTSPAFNELLASNPFLALSLEDQFILGSRYLFTLNTQNQESLRWDGLPETRKQDFFFSGGVDISGIIINLIQKIFGREETGEPLTLFGEPYSQYVRLEADFRYYLRFRNDNALVFRINPGAGFAYENSKTLPYIKQFATGGANSIRAFPARSVGPGTFRDTTDVRNTFFVDQRADLKLEGNTEFRFGIAGFFKGAVFIDAGNIWSRKPDVERPGSEFSRSTFIKELAVGTGFGLRLDFNFFLLRFDLGFPLRIPYLPEGERWVIRDINPGSRQWRKDNLILNIAIGYPF